MPSRAFANSSGATGQYLSASPFSNNMTTFTLTAWVYPTSIPDFATASYLPVLWKGADSSGPRDLQGPSMSIYSDANGNLQLWCQQTYDTQDASVFTLLTGQLKLNVWSLIAFVVNADSAGSAQGFVNGVEVVYDPALSAPAIGTPDDDSAHSWTVSVDQPGNVNSSSFSGYVSDTRIYTRTLSAAELLTLTAFGNPSSTGLVAEWKMCGNSPEVDSVGGHSMTVHLATVSANQPYAFCGSVAYSEPDDRNFSVFPNNAQNTQGTLQYTAPAHPSHAPPVDSRAAGAPVDSRISADIPINSRAPGTFGPGE